MPFIVDAGPDSQGKGKHIGLIGPLTMFLDLLFSTTRSDLCLIPSGFICDGNDQFLTYITNTALTSDYCLTAYQLHALSNIYKLCSQ